MKLGIIGAMDLETNQLIDRMTVAFETYRAGMVFYTGTIDTKSVVVVTSGVGKVNAAACAQSLISEFGVEGIVNTGVSGAVSQSLEIGDIVISTDCVEHDFDCTAFGYAPGVIPRLKESVFRADERLAELAYQAAISQTGQQVVKGRIVSGDQFISSLERKQVISDLFGAATTEMEGAAIAHVCYLNQIPFVVIRSMSDQADGTAHENFDDFAKSSAYRSSQIVQKMLKTL